MPSTESQVKRNRVTQFITAAVAVCALGLSVFNTVERHVRPMELIVRRLSFDLWGPLAAENAVVSRLAFVNPGERTVLVAGVVLSLRARGAEETTEFIWLEANEESPPSPFVVEPGETVLRRIVFSSGEKTILQAVDASQPDTLVALATISVVVLDHGGHEREIDLRGIRLWYRRGRYFSRDATGDSEVALYSNSKERVFSSLGGFDRPGRTEAEWREVLSTEQSSANGDSTDERGYGAP